MKQGFKARIINGILWNGFFKFSVTVTAFISNLIQPLFASYLLYITHLSQNFIMKILITAPRLNSGGVNVFVKSIVGLFEDAVVFYRGRSMQKPSLLKGILNGVMMPFQFLLKLISAKPDRIIVNTSLGKATLVRDGLLVAIAKMMRYKVLLIIHGFDDSALMYKQLLKCGYFKADAIIVLAEAFKKLIIDSGYRRPVYTQYNPVDENLVKFLANSPQRDKSEMNNILFLARIEKAKGIYETIDAFRLISQKHKDSVLNIAGSGSELENVRKYIEENRIERINILGFKDKEEKYKVLAENDVMLFSSYREGLPICVLEAMAAGQLVLTRPLGGLVDLYKECKFGEIIDTLEPSDFAEAYEKYANDKELTLDVRIRNQAFAANFLPKKIVANIERILDTL